MSLTKVSPIYLFSGLLAIIHFCLVREMPFFWDTIQLVSKHASFFYENNLTFSLLPDSIDSGHPPLVGYYVAVCWKLFGRSLWVTHAAFLPFIWLIILCICQYTKRISPDQQLVWPAAIFLLLDPFFVAQASIMSPDIILIAGFLLIFVHFRNYLAVLTGAILLASVSSRGAMVLAASGLVHLIHIMTKRGWTWSHVIRISTAYVPGGLVFLLFNAWHYSEKGWIGYHADSPWAPCFEQVDFSGFCKNLAILLWRMFDFGRIFILLLIATMALKYRKKWWLTQQVLLRWLLILSIFLLPSFLIYTGLNAHRYIWPILCIINLIGVTSVFQFLHIRKAMLMLLMGSAIFILAHLWVYPDKISQGWDVTLAHQAFHPLMQDMKAYLIENEIDPKEIGTAFPATNSDYHIYLGTDKTALRAKDLDTDTFILYSNIMNDFTDSELDRLRYEFEVMYFIQKNNIKLILYKRKT